MNRELMIRLIIEEIGVDWNRDKMIETIHNYIDFTPIFKLYVIFKKKQDILVITMKYHLILALTA